VGFDFDKYKGSGGNYIVAAEKQVLAENGIPFTITAIRVVHKFDQENFELSIEVPNPETGEQEERVFSFPIGTGAESRDSMLAGMQEYLAEGGEPVTAKVEKIGRAFFISQA
jgi:hypothetical protein